MNYYVFNNTMKYDNIGNEGKGLYRTWVCEIEPRNPEEYKSIWLRHDEVFDRESYSWRTIGKTLHEIEMDDKKYDTLRCVKAEECSESDMWIIYEPLQRKGDAFIFDKKNKGGIRWKSMVFMIVMVVLIVNGIGAAQVI